MFGKLAKEKHKRDENSQHNRIICEMVEDVITTDDDEGVIDLSDIDSVISNDSMNVTEDDMDAIEQALESMSDVDATDISKMTEEELNEYIKELDQ